MQIELKVTTNCPNCKKVNSSEFDRIFGRFIEECVFCKQRYPVNIMKLDVKNV